MTNDLRDAVAHALWRSEGAVLGVENLRTVNAFLELPSGTLAAWRSQAAAAISAMRGARVKPLEWKLTSTGFEAKTLAGTYEVYASIMTEHWFWRGENGIALDQYEGKEADLDAAKAAAQADYERRILSALTPTVPSVHEAARVLIPWFEYQHKAWAHSKGRNPEDYVSHHTAAADALRAIAGEGE